MDSAAKRASLKHYIAIARPDHWPKNALMLPGAALGLIIDPHHETGWPIDVMIGLVCACLIASANYTINEYLDGSYDRHHPTKSDRPTAQGLINPYLVMAQYVALAGTGLIIASFLNLTFLFASIALLVMGVLYNVKPFRTKDFAYLDVLSESINNPIRFVLGWATVTTLVFPPVSVLIAYWMGGAFLMTVKRLAEYRMIANPDQAARYRRSFKNYTEELLLSSSFFYAIFSSFFLAIFLFKYKIEFILCFPLFALLFAWYLKISLRPKSTALNPEKIYREPRFLAYVCFLVGVVCVLFLVRIPPLDHFVTHTAIQDMRLQ